MANNINLVPLKTFYGATAGERVVGSITELQVKRIMTNRDFFEMSFTNTLKSENVSVMNGIGTAIYRLPIRVVWGAKYDNDTGAVRQRTGATHATFNIDKALNIKVMLEDYDLERLMSANPSTRGTMVGEWVRSFTENLILNKELIFRQAIKTYCIARYNKADDIPSVLVYDEETLKTKEGIEAFFMKLLNLMTLKKKQVNQFMVGTDKGDWNMALSQELYNKCLPAFTQFIDTTGAKTLTSGEWFENKAFGYGFYRDLLLNTKWDKTKPNGANNDIDFDLMGLDGIIAHKADWVAPDAWESLKTVLDTNTGNVQWLGKYLFGLPMPLYGMTTIIMSKEPTAEEIAKAKAQCLKPGTVSDMTDLETFRVQLSRLDPLANESTVRGTDITSIITNISLGKIKDNNAETIIAGIKARNNKAKDATLFIDNISSSQAVVSASSYVGSITVSFTL